MTKSLNSLIKLTIIISISFLSSCEQEFTNIESDLINNDNATSFDLNSYKYDIKTFNKATGPYQSNNLPLNKLGVYNDPLYGTTQASVLTEINLPTFNPDFGVNDETFISLNSVVLTLPLSNTATNVDENGSVTYELDSIFPVDANSDNKFKLEIFRSNYFLRAYNPNGDFDEPQNYFSNKSLSHSEQINPSLLEAERIYQNDDFFFDNSEIVITNDDDPDNPTRLAPRIRIEFTPDDTDLTGFDFWFDNIIAKEGSAELSNANNFKDFIRGLYFKATPNNSNDGAMMFLNFNDANANIVLNYTVENPEPTEDPIDETFTINFSGTKLDFAENNYNFTLDNDTNEDASLYLKGGEGAIAEIELFDGAQNDEDFTTDNTFEAWRKRFVNLDASGKYDNAKRIVTEANIIFYVDQNILSTTSGFKEPNRIFIYDLNNNIPLVDYFLDNTNSVFAEFSRFNHLGVLQRENDDPDGLGIKYKLKITEHINNLLLRDSTNVKLGIAVSTNVNLESGSVQRLYQVPGSTTEEKNIPLSSAISVRGTVLHGSLSTDTEKQPKLEIFYACLDTDETDCNEP